MISLTTEDIAGMNAINARIPGWSDAKHYGFFKYVLAEMQWITDLLVVGVYQGRDIAYILDIAARYHPGRTLNIVGVDKFNDEPCDDWPKDRRGLGWKEAGFGDAPSYSKACENLKLQEHHVSGPLVLHRISDEEYLRITDRTFDFVYFDTDHTAETVARQLRQAPRITRENALIAGDDYSDAGTWGVKRAVAEGFVNHNVFAKWIWFADRKDLKPDLTPCSPLCNSSKT